MERKEGKGKEGKERKGKKRKKGRKEKKRKPVDTRQRAKNRTLRNTYL